MREGRGCRVFRGGGWVSVAAVRKRFRQVDVRPQGYNGESNDTQLRSCFGAFRSYKSAMKLLLFVKFKRSTGMSLPNYINELRIEQAKHLLK